MDYKNVFPIEKTDTWDEIGEEFLSNTIMHSAMFRTKCSENHNAEHTFILE